MLTDRKITTYQDNIKDLSDTPSSDGVAAETLKNIFDGRTDKEIKGSINGIVDDLTSITDGSSGADNIGATALKENGATTVQGQLEELDNEKASVIGLASSTDGASGADSVGSTPLKDGGSSTVQGQLEELKSEKVDKVTGKELSANDFTDAYRTKLDGIEENANNYVLPIASTTVVGGVKAGVSIEILPDGTINGLSAPAPDYPAREAIAQEIANRQAEYQTLSDRIDYEESERIQVDTDLQNQITTNKNAVNVNISETARTLYGLSASDANVDKALQKIWNKAEYIVETITSSRTWTSPITGEIEVFMCGGGGGGATDQTNFGGGGGGGFCKYFTLKVIKGQQIPITIGIGGVPGTVDKGDAGNGGDTTFGNFTAKGGKGGSGSRGGNGTGGGGSNGKGGNSVYGESGAGNIGKGPKDSLGDAVPISICGLNPIDGLTYGSGGGSAVYDSSRPPNKGNVEAGNGGIYISNTVGENALPNRGGGGGGASGTAIPRGGYGGSGAVVIGYYKLIY